MTIGPEPITSTWLRSVRRGISRVLPAIRSTNWSNRYSASCGPAAASGWYCTEKARPSTSLMPSTTPSLAQVWLTSAAPNGVSNPSPASPSSAKPWFCAVTATRPVAWSITGTLMPRCPNTILYVERPSARPRIWLPKQMPNSGIPAPSTSRVTPTMWSAVAGSPGPLDRNTPSGFRSAICSKVAVDGSTWLRMPRRAKLRGVLVLMPRSIAATVKRCGPSGSTT